MRTTPKVPDLTGLTPLQVSQQLAGTSCATCRETVIHMLSNANRPLVDWIINTRCGHSKLCLEHAKCTKCGLLFLRCIHCRSAHRQCNVCASGTTIPPSPPTIPPPPVQQDAL